jgi:hypothetical protein
MPAMSTLDLFLGDRYAVIIVTLPQGSDAATVAVNVGKAFSAAAAKIPPAPDMRRHD